VNTKPQPESGTETGDTVLFTKYDRRSLTYANSFDDGLTSFIIRLMEWMTGKITILRMIRKF